MKVCSIRTLQKHGLETHPPWYWPFNCKSMFNIPSLSHWERNTWQWLLPTAVQYVTQSKIVKIRQPSHLLPWSNLMCYNSDRASIQAVPPVMNIVESVVEEDGKLPSKFEFATSNRTCTAYFVAVGWVWGWRISSSSSKAWLTHLSLSSSKTSNLSHPTNNNSNCANTD